MIKINNPYSENFKNKYWEWFYNKFELDDVTLFSEIFKEDCYPFSREYYLRDIIINKNTYEELSKNLIKININKLNLDLLHEYSNFTSRDSLKRNTEMNAIKLYNEINIKVCPYCNLSNISLYKTSKATKRGHLDHFYPKEKYPYLALSLYNLVPSCYYCNSNFKGSKEVSLDKYIHPYFDNFGSNAKFDYIPSELNLDTDYDEIFGELNYLIVFKYRGDENRIRNNNILFQLVYDRDNNVVGVYQEELDYVEDLINKIRRYPKSKINEISRVFNNESDYKNVFEDIFGRKVAQKEMINISKSKLRKDILDKYSIE